MLPQAADRVSRVNDHRRTQIAARLDPALGSLDAGESQEGVRNGSGTFFDAGIELIFCCRKVPDPFLRPCLLVEAGTRFIQVNWYGEPTWHGWDVHGADMPGLVRTEAPLCPRLDQGCRPCWTTCTSAAYCPGRWSSSWANSAARRASILRRPRPLAAMRLGLARRLRRTGRRRHRRQRQPPRLPGHAPGQHPRAGRHGLPDKLYHAVRPMLAASDGRVICLSTRFGRVDSFAEFAKLPPKKAPRPYAKLCKLAGRRTHVLSNATFTATGEFADHLRRFANSRRKRAAARPCPPISKWIYCASIFAAGVPRHSQRSDSGRIAPPCMPEWPPSPGTNL